MTLTNPRESKPAHGISVDILQHTAFQPTYTIPATVPLPPDLSGDGSTTRAASATGSDSGRRRVFI